VNKVIAVVVFGLAECALVPTPCLAQGTPKQGGHGSGLYQSSASGRCGSWAEVDHLLPRYWIADSCL
jgi:hypothetical protein